MSDGNNEYKQSLAKLRSRLTDLGLIKTEPPPRKVTTKLKRGRPRTLRGHQADTNRKQALANYWNTDIQEIWARHLMSRLKRQAKEQGTEFDLCKDDLKALADDSDMQCAVLGIKLRYGRGAHGGHTDLMTVERIDERGPFTRDNMVIVSALVRTVRGYLTTEQCITLGHYCEMLPRAAPVSEAE